ncbi:MAG TPA: arsenosugar biosynthesis radical SAM protein ArsS [Saprospiraceae bacterium]|nr:arsenosugar biosynthesis radical SAM protein ArsS [Lewinellaceae bacterium]HRX27815.1 arsenosugar biosynthesis radical SAM protein ArsS [Saprospiraceae bacterium]
MGVKQRSKSLSASGNQLANTFFQLEILNKKELLPTSYVKFKDKIAQVGVPNIDVVPVEIFQLNIGKLCNQTCAHCHVDAGPDKKEEQMTKPDLERCLLIIKAVDSIHTVDITGGAPEMNVNFRWFVTEVRKLNKKIINRCNLTIIRSNPKYYDLPEFFAENKVHIVSSLPYFSASRTDKQRGDGVFEDSISALQMLNKVGYGIVDNLKLDLVYNPSGAFLPGSQCSLENEFKRQLLRRYDVKFHNLLCITNLPISRFLDYLIETDNYTDYMETLANAFNPATLDGLMCKNTISVSWDGNLYDCDFNQMLNLKVASNSQHISNFDVQQLNQRKVIINEHCYGCTAGAGSSCGGELV